MTQDEAFLADIIANPDDDTPRLVYADWLEDHGRQPRAEFIRLQCELARLPRRHPRRETLETREQELLEAHRSRWDREVKRLGDEREYHRGFVEAVTFKQCRKFIKAAPALFDLAPVRRLTLVEIEGWKDLEKLQALEQLRRLTYLKIADTGPGDDEEVDEEDHWDERTLDEFLSSPVLSGLTALDLCGGRWGEELAHIIAEAANLSGLSVLDLRGNLIGPRGMEVLAGAAHLSGLTTLLIGWGGEEDLSNELGSDGIGALIRSPYLTRLQVLDLSDNEMDADDVAAVMSAPSLAHLNALELCFNKFGPAGAEVLAASPLAANLAYAGFYSTNLGDAGAAALLASPHLSNEIELDMDEDISEDMVEKLEARFPNLTFGADHPLFKNRT
jgi:uncharacterized protein (TIGR02996 family)